jgi:hypothetical protein
MTLIDAYCINQLLTKFHIISKNQQWNIVEGVLWALCAISIEARKWLNGGEDVSEEVRVQVVMQLEAFISRLHFLSSDPRAVSSAVSFLGGYSKWIDSRVNVSPPILMHVMNYFISSLSVREAVETSSKSLQAICISCAKHLGNPSSLHSLITTLEDVISSPSNVLNEVQRCTVTEGISRVIATLQYHDVIVVLQALTSPMLKRLEYYLSIQVTSSNNQELCRRISEELASLGSSLRFIQNSSHNRHPISSIFEAAW